MRTFVAITPPKNIQPALASLQTQIVAAVESAGLSTRAFTWSGHAKAHLTLRFLGEMHNSQRAPLESGLQEIAARHAHFTLTLRGIGVFPTWRKASVLWIGIETSAALHALQAEIEQAAQQVGFPAEVRPFAAHLTLARIQTRSGDEARRLGEVLYSFANTADLSRWQSSFDVSTIEFMRSELNPTGAIYTMLARYALGTQE